MQAKIDGDQVMIHADNFVNLQESPAIFIPRDSELGRELVIEITDYAWDFETGDQTLGQIAFEAYCTAKAGITYDSKPIPAWGELGEAVKNGWEAAAQAVCFSLGVIGIAHE